MAETESSTLELVVGWGCEAFYHFNHVQNGFKPEVKEWLKENNINCSMPDFFYSKQQRRFLWSCSFATERDLAMFKLRWVG